LRSDQYGPIIRDCYREVIAVCGEIMIMLRHSSRLLFE
jgi:hypothetical protein